MSAMGTVSSTSAFSVNAHSVAVVRISAQRSVHGAFSVRDVAFEMEDGSTFKVTAFSDGLKPINVVIEPALTDSVVAEDPRA